MHSLCVRERNDLGINSLSNTLPETEYKYTHTVSIRLAKPQPGHISHTSLRERVSGEKEQLYTPSHWDHTQEEIKGERERNRELRPQGKREVKKERGTVEFRSLHTLRLESLILVFQPLHKFLVSKL